MRMDHSSCSSQSQIDNLTTDLAAKASASDLAAGLANKLNSADLDTSAAALVTNTGSVTAGALRDAFGRGGGIAYVAMDGNDANNGASWATAKRSVKAAVQALPLAQSGAESFRAGTVYIGPGEFIEQGDIEANREIRFVGANAKSDNVGTRIRLADGANKHVFTYGSAFAAADGFAHGLVFENLTVSANVAGQGTAAVATGGITAGATTLPLANAGSLPTSEPFDVLIDDEVIGVTAGAGSASLTINRGKYGSVAAAHAAGAVVRFAGSAIVMFAGAGSTPS